MTARKADHASADQVDSFRSGRLPVPDQQRLREHTKSCLMCREALFPMVESAGVYDSLIDVLETTAGVHVNHLQFDELWIAACSKQQLNAHVRAHLESCAQCRHDLSLIERQRSVSSHGSKARQFLQPYILTLAATSTLIILAVLWTREHSGWEARRKDNQLVARQNIDNIGYVPAEYRAAVAAALTNGKLALPDSLRELEGLHGVLMGEPGREKSQNFLFPAGVVVEEERPVFRWKGEQGAKYQVSIYDAVYHQIAQSNWIYSAKWQVPNALRRGELYLWQLRIRLNGHDVMIPAAPEPEARFRVLSTANERDLERARAVAAGSHITLAMLYSKLGMVREARDELLALQNQRPELGIVNELLRNLPQVAPITMKGAQ